MVLNNIWQGGVFYMKNIGFVLLILMTCLFIGSTENFLKENSEPIGVVWFGYTAQEVNLLAYDGTGWVSFDSSNSGFPDKDVMGIAVDEIKKLIWKQGV